MSEQQIPQLAEAIVTHQRHLGNLSSDDAQWAIQNTVAAIGLFVDAVKNRTMTEVKKLLEFLFSFNAKAVEKFVAKEKFIEGKTTDGVSVSWLGENFKKNFLGKIERNVKAAELKVQKLLETATDLPQEDEPGIIPELVGKHRTFLAHFFQLLAHKQQTKDYSWLVGYICDENGVLWTVGAYWFVDGWVVGADSVVRPSRWSAGDQVLSR
ncbi:MAG: hypothetical protein AAB850_00365 [Patescibacteria group bacterium]